MYNKYFTVEVKPDIDASLLNAAALASDDDVIFSWTPFEVPKGSSRLLNVTARVAGNDGTAQHHPFQLIFAKSKVNAKTGVLTNPYTLGEFNDVATFLPSVNEAIGAVKIDTVDYLCQSLVGASLASTGNSVTDSGSSCDLVLTPSGSSDHANYKNDGATTTITPGYDVLWVAGIACGAMNFASTVQTNGELTTSDSSVTVDTKDATLVFSPGDVIQDVANQAIGTIESLTATAITLTGKSSSAVGNNVKIYHRNPITLILSFEK
jgi:hypothetical protein